MPLQLAKTLEIGASVWVYSWVREFWNVAQITDSEIEEPNPNPSLTQVKFQNGVFVAQKNKSGWEDLNSTCQSLMSDSGLPMKLSQQTKSGFSISMNSDTDKSIW